MLIGARTDLPDRIVHLDPAAMNCTEKRWVKED